MYSRPLAVQSLTLAEIDPTAYLEYDEEAPELWSAWIGDELIGSGESAWVAIVEAVDTLANWQVIS
jgi:hypothetical protein